MNGHPGRPTFGRYKCHALRSASIGPRNLTTQLAYGAELGKKKDRSRPGSMGFLSPDCPVLPSSRMILRLAYGETEDGRQKRDATGPDRRTPFAGTQASGGDRILPVEAAEGLGPFLPRCVHPAGPPDHRSRGGGPQSSGPLLRTAARPRPRPPGRAPRGGPHPEAHDGRGTLGQPCHRATDSARGPGVRGGARPVGSLLASLSRTGALPAADDRPGHGVLIHNDPHRRLTAASRDSPESPATRVVLSGRSPSSASLSPTAAPSLAGGTSIGPARSAPPGHPPKTGTAVSSSAGYQKSTGDSGGCWLPKRRRARIFGP